MNTKNIYSAAWIFFLLQLHTWHFSKAATEIWSKSILKCHTISFPHIIEYIAVTRKHHNMLLLEIMMQLHNRQEMPGRCVTDSQLGPGRWSITFLQDTDAEIADRTQAQPLNRAVPAPYEAVAKVP